MTAGGSGMNYGDDYVAARLSVDIGEGSSQAIRELTQEVERLHVTMEATVRAESDMTRYLDGMAESARKAAEMHRELNQQLQDTISLSARGGVSSGVPVGPAVQPFTGMQAGMGGPARAPSPSDVAYQIQSHAANNQREYLNMQSARGNISSGDMMSLSSESIAELANKISERDRVVRDQLNKTDGNADSKVSPGGQGPQDPAGAGIGERMQRASSLVGQVINEVGVGGSAMSTANMAVRGLDWARRRYASGANSGRGTPSGGEADSGGPAMPAAGDAGAGGEEAAEDKATAGLGGVLGGLAKYLGPIAGVATAGLTAFGLIEKGGGMVQGMRNVASVRGGAAGEGFEVETKARIMAMNPFLTQDQSRQIYQAVMSEGYADASGAGADNVIDFMKTNLTSMNISVAESSKMLRGTIMGNVKGDPESVAGSVEILRKELDTIRTLSREGVMSTPDFRAGVWGTQQALMDAGGSPEQAGYSAMVAEQVDSGKQNMKGQFGKIAGQMSSDRNGTFLRNFGGPGGTPLQNIDPRLFPQVTAEALQEQGGDAYNQAVMNSLKFQADQVAATQEPQENQVYLFQQRLRQQGLDIDATSSRPSAKRLLDEVRSGEMGEELKKSEDELSKQGVSSRSSGGGNNANVTGSVQIDLSPEARQLLSLRGGNTVQLTKTQVNANRGMAGAQVNSPGAD